MIDISRLRLAIATAPIDQGLKKQYLDSLDYTMKSLTLTDQQKKAKVQIVVSALQAALEAAHYNSLSTMLWDTFTETFKNIGQEVAAVGKVALDLKKMLLNKWVLLAAGLVALGIVLWINYGASFLAGKRLK